MSIAPQLFGSHPSRSQKPLSRSSIALTISFPTIRVPRWVTMGNDKTNQSPIRVQAYTSSFVDAMILVDSWKSLGRSRD
jgi:hypothetical protein